MKQLFTNVSTTSVIAVLVNVCGFGLLFYMAVSNRPKNDTRATQIITLSGNVVMVVAGYYFGASKQRGGLTQNADTISNSPAIGDKPTQ